MIPKALLLLTLLTLTHSLTHKPSCPALLNYYKRNALSRVGPYGFSPFPVFLRKGAALPLNLASAPAQADSAPRLAASAPQARAAPPPEAGVDFSETNVQVEGVDEADIVKTDGERVYVIRGKIFYIVDVTEQGASGVETGNITLPSRGREMLIHEDRVIVIADGFQRFAPFRSVASSLSFRSTSVTTVYHIDISGSVPKLISTLTMDGQYVSSREVDGTARLIIKFNPIRKFRFSYPIHRFTSDTESATEENRHLISVTTIHSWLPTYTLKFNCPKAPCRQLSGLLTECNRVYVPNRFTGFGILTVVTLKLLGNLRPRNTASIFSESGDVYSTAKSLYVAATQYRYDFGVNSLLLGRNFKTYLHKFELRPNGAKFIGTGHVFGSVLNQFSMHEHNNIFFVATTEGAPWWRSRDTSRSKVTSFKVSDGKLVKIGEVGNLGIGERIFAVRYIQDTAYVVTFRQIDPLYIIDLSKPYSLVVTGELKIPGFSSYLHPIASGRLLGVGREATLQGRTTGAKVSLFDVSDVYNPKEIASWTLKGSFTSAQFDHRAFLWWAPEKIAVLPVSVSASKVKERFVGSIVLDVADDGITERGRIVHEKCCSSFSRSIERNFVIGRIHLWSLSRDLLQVNSIKDLAFESIIKIPYSTFSS